MFVFEILRGSETSISEHTGIRLKYDLTVPRLSSSDQIHPIITKFQPLECFFYKYVFDEYLNMFLEGSETFISAILASRVKIRVQASLIIIYITLGIYNVFEIFWKFPAYIEHI